MHSGTQADDPTAGHPTLSAEICQSLIEQVAEGVIIADTHRTIIEANPQSCMLLGYQLHELLGRTWDTLIPPNNKDLLAQISSLSVGSGMHSECRLRRQSGRLISVELRARHMQNGQLLILVRDRGEREEVQRVLRERNDLEDRLAKIIATAPGVICFFQQWPDGSACNPYASPAVVDLFGLTAEELAHDSAPVLDLMHPDDVERVAANINESARTLQPWHDEYRIRHPARGEIWIEGHSIPERQADGSTIWYGFLQDVTERRQVDAQLRENAERLRLALEAANQGLYDLNIQTGEAHVNPEYALMLGYDPEAFHETNAAWIKRLHPDDRDRVIANFKAYISGEIPAYAVEFRQRTAQGPWKWILSVGKIVAWDDAGNPLRMLGTHTDITERKQAEAIMREREEWLRMAYDAAEIGHWQQEFASGKVVFDQHTSAHFGFSSGEVPAEEVLKRVHPEDWERLYNTQNAALSDPSGNTRYAVEFRVVHPDGSIRWLALQARIIFMENSNLPRRPLIAVGTSQDITARKQFEAQILQINEELEQRVAERTAQLEATNKELEAFTYSVSHDLRAPLRAIDGYTRIIEEDYAPALDEEGQRVCAVVRGETRRMGELIDDLLAFSRLGRTLMQPEPINMAEMARAVFDELSASLDRERITFQVDDLPTAVGDARLIRQVWVNLLSNAIKFSSKSEQPQIELGSGKTSAEIIYWVRDNGAGFDMRYADKLFGVFQRLHSEREFEGTGVGLAIVQRIIHRHNGKVWAEGSIGAGATFFFTLPHIGAQQ